MTRRTPPAPDRAARRGPGRSPAARAAALGLLLSTGAAWGQQAPAVAPAPAATPKGEAANLSRPEKGTAEALLAIDTAYA